MKKKAEKKKGLITGDSFKKNYAECKNRYRNLNPPDSIYQFNYFKDMLNDLKIKTLQTNNMINVLLSRLTTSEKANKKNNTKAIQKENRENKDSS